MSAKKTILTRKLAVMGLVGIAAVSFAQTASSYSSGALKKESTGETCLYSQQLQTSVAARRHYLTAVADVLGRNDVGAVAGMYGDIRPASYTADEVDADDGVGRKSIFELYASKKPVETPGLDAFSADCVGCHDGVSASSIGVDLRNSPIRKRSTVVSFKSDHPMGMDYNAYVMGSRGFKRISQGTKMLFVDGKVGCLTCHDPLNPEKGHLVMSDRESALCKTCHDK